MKVLFITLFLFFYCYSNEIPSQKNENSVSFTKEELDYIQKKKVIKVHTESSWYPFSFVNDYKPSGYIHDLKQLFSKKTGLELEVTPRSYDEAINDLLSGKIDVMFDLGKREEFTDKLIFNKNHTIFYYEGILSQKAYKGLEELDNKTVGYIAGLDHYSDKYKEVNFKAFEDDEKMITALLRGQIDAAVNSYITLKYFLDNMNIVNDILKLHLLRDMIDKESFYYHIATQKSNQILMDIINKTITSQDILNIQRKWGFIEDNLILNIDTELTKKELDYLASKKSFNVCIRPNHSPISNHSEGKINGIVGDVLNEVSKELKIDFKPIPSNSNLEFVNNLKSNKCELVDIVKHDFKGFENIVSSKFPILSQKFSAIATVDIPYIEELEESDFVFIVNKKLHNDILAKKYPNLKVIFIDDLDLIASRLKNSKKTAYLTLSILADYFIQNYGIHDYKIIDSFENLKIEGSIGVNKTLANDFLPILNKTLEKIGKDKIDNIVFDYKIKEFQTNISYQWLFYVVFVLAFVIIFIQNRNSKSLGKLNKSLQQKEKKLEEQNTQLLNSQIELEKTSIEYKSLFNNAPNLYIVLDKSFKIINYNNLAAEYFSFDKEKEFERYFPMLLSGDSRNEFFEIISTICNENISANFSMKLPTGVNNRFKITFDNHRTNEDQYILSLVDIEKEFMLVSEMNSLNMLLKSEIQRFKLAIEGSQNGIYDWNVNSNEIYFSPVWKEIVGYDDNELENKFETLESLCHPDDLEEMQKIIFDYVSNPVGNLECRFRMKHKDGHWVWINSKGVASFDANGNINRIVGSHLDITPLIEYELKLEEKVRKQIEEIRQRDFKMLNQAKLASLGEMMSNIAHQWKQPLNVISINSSMMLFNIEREHIDKEHLKQEVNMIINSCNYLSKTISTFSKYLSKNKKYGKYAIENEIVSAMTIVTPTLLSNKIKIYEEIDYGKNHKVHMVENELSEVIINILYNAEHALKEVDSKQKELWIKISFEEKEDVFVLMIEDNAGGIPDEVLPRIFEPYFTTKFKAEGTGLGLSMSYNIITESIKGDIYVENTQNGAKFFIELPKSID